MEMVEFKRTDLMCPGRGGGGRDGRSQVGDQQNSAEGRVGGGRKMAPSLLPCPSMNRCGWSGRVSLVHPPPSGGSGPRAKISLRPCFKKICSKQVFSSSAFFPKKMVSFRTKILMISKEQKYFGIFSSNETKVTWLTIALSSLVFCLIFFQPIIFPLEGKKPQKMIFVLKKLVCKNTLIFCKKKTVFLKTGQDGMSRLWANFGGGQEGSFGP